MICRYYKIHFLLSQSYLLDYGILKPNSNYLITIKYILVSSIFNSICNVIFTFQYLIILMQSHLQYFVLRRICFRHVGSRICNRSFLSPEKINVILKICGQKITNHCPKNFLHDSFH